MNILIKQGRVVNPSTKIDGIYDVLIEGGKVSQISESIEVSQSECVDVIDAKGKLVMPGMIDIHVHLREPGYDYKETIKTGTMAAAAGGVTTVACMPNTYPVIHDTEVVEWVQKKVEEDGVVNVEVIGAITEGIAGINITPIEDMIKKGIAAISDDGRTTMNSDIMKEAFEIIKPYNVPLISHTEDHDLSKGGCMNLGVRSEELGLPGIPTEAESNIVKRDIDICESVNAKLHIAHISTKKSLDYIVEARERGVEVTCEICPHHFILDESIIEKNDPITKVNPPIRAKSDVAAMVDGILKGHVDCIVTDHAPHEMDSKTVSYEKASFGICGLETLFALSYSELVRKYDLPLSRLVEMMTVAPAKVIGSDKGDIAVGKDADIAIIDLNEEYKINTAEFYSKGKNTPFDGTAVYGKILTTIVGGKVVYNNGGFTA